MCHAWPSRLNSSSCSTICLVRPFIILTYLKNYKMPIFKNSTQLFMKKIQITFTNLRKASPTQYIWHGLCNTVSEKPYVILATDNRFLLQSLDSSSPITRRGPPCHTLFLSNKRKEKSNSFRLMRRKRSRFDSNSHNQPKFSYFDEICSNPIQQKQEVI